MEDTIKETLQEILKRLEITYKKIKIGEEKKEKKWNINIESEESSLLIGYHGETMYALQHLLKILLWKKEEMAEENKIFLDIDKYRKRQEESVLAMAERKAEQVRKTGKSLILLPMSAYFRRLIHLYIMKHCEDLETESIGEGDRRQIVIKTRKV